MEIQYVNRRDWTPADVKKLYDRVGHYMELCGHIDLRIIAKELNRTEGSLRCKVDFLKIPYKRKPTIPDPVFERRIKDDMMTLPKHTKGKLKGRNVDYNNSWRL